MAIRNPYSTGNTPFRRMNTPPTRYPHDPTAGYNYRRRFSFGPSETKAPETPSCPDGYVWDSTRNACVQIRNEESGNVESDFTWAGKWNPNYHYIIDRDIDDDGNVSSVTVQNPAYGDGTYETHDRSNTSQGVLNKIGLHGVDADAAGWESGLTADDLMAMDPSLTPEEAAKMVAADTSLEPTAKVGFRPQGILETFSGAARGIGDFVTGGGLLGAITSGGVTKGDAVAGVPGAYYDQESGVGTTGDGFATGVGADAHYANMEDWGKVRKAGNATGWSGGIMSASSYNQLSAKGKENYEKFIDEYNRQNNTNITGGIPGKNVTTEPETPPPPPPAPTPTPPPPSGGGNDDNDPPDYGSDHDFGYSLY